MRKTLKLCKEFLIFYKNSFVYIFTQFKKKNFDFETERKDEIRRTRSE